MRRPLARAGGEGLTVPARAGRSTAAVAAAVAATLAAAVAAWWVVSLRPFSGGATVAVVLAGAGAAAVGTGWRRGRGGRTAGSSRRSRRSRPRPGRGAVGVPGLAPWGVVVAAGAGWQLAAWLQHPRSEHPTLSSLTNALLDSQPARAVAFLLWVAAMVELARR